MGSGHSKSYVFPIRIQSKTHAFSNASFGASFFEALVRLDAKMLDLGTPLAPSWAQNGGQNRASIAKRLKKSIRGAHFLWSWKTTCFQDRFRNAPGHHFFGFLMDFDTLFKDLLIFNQILGINLGHRFARRPKQACCFIANF